MSAMTFSDLPDDILDIVFEKLDIRRKFLYQRVSRKWSGIIFNTCTKFDNTGNGFDCHEQDHLIIPSLDCWYQRGSEAEQILKKLGSNLNAVHLMVCGKEDVQVLVENCPYVRCLSIYFN